MSYEFHKGDLYVEMLDQFNNSHGEHVPASVADLVAALIAEGGETIWWCQEHKQKGRRKDKCIMDSYLTIQGATVSKHCRVVEALVFPVPVESAEAKET